MSDIKYGEAALNAREHFSNKVKKELNKSATEQGLRFIKLTSLIPNWETYLTPKQQESAVKYLKSMNARDVDYQLKLTSGTTHQRLFGGKTSKGAVGKLEEVYKMLESNGHFAEHQRKKDQTQVEKKKVKLTKKSLEKVKELFTLIIEIPDYEQYITKSQRKKVDELLKTRSFISGAKVCGVTTETYQNSLIGDNSVLEKLKKIKEERTVNSWGEV